MIEVIFDIETKKLFDQIPDPEKPEDLGVSIVSAYRRVIDPNNGLELEGEMKSFWENEMEGLKKWFFEADRIIGFNSLKFDVPVLAPLVGGRDFVRLPHFDMLEKIRETLGFRIGLGALAKETLHQGKLGDGLSAVDWWNKGDEESLAKLKKYCEMDVEVTKRLYDVGYKGEKLRFMNKWNELKEFAVDFSYPKKKEEAQLGLF